MAVDIGDLREACRAVRLHVFVRHLIGVGAPRVEHALLATDDVKLADRFFCEVLDFYATERVSDLARR